MKMTKRFFALAAVLALLLCLGCSAFADEAQYKSTQTFISEISEIEGFTAELNSVRTESGGRQEIVSVTYEGGDLSQYKSRLAVSFDEPNEEVTIWLFNLINFAQDNFDKVLAAVNKINADSTGVKLYVDETDNSVTAEMYLIVPADTTVAVAEQGLGFMIGFTDKAYEMLSEYAA